jgi:glycosyltransferase involved in cell wall biosynthesis
LKEADCKNESVSIIIPTFNSGQELDLCLKSIHAQTYPNIAVIVVDNFSVDNTRNIAETFGVNFLLHKGTPAAARNVGVRAAKSKYVLFVDSDQCLSSNVVAECVAICSYSNVAAVKIPEIFIGLNFWAKCSAFWKNHMVKTWGKNGGIPRFFIRDLLVGFCGFNNKLRFWEDQEFNHRLEAAGVKIVWCESKVSHRESGSLREVTRKYLSYGKSIADFNQVDAKGPYSSTTKLTLLTMLDVLKHPGYSLRLFIGFIFLFTLKSCCAALGFLINRAPFSWNSDLDKQVR